MTTQHYFHELKKLKYADESRLLDNLINKNDWINNPSISQNASSIVENCRKDKNKTRLDSFFLEYGLSNQEGVALMCLAESLLRIPDNKTCDDIIEEKIGGKKWLDHLNKSPSIFVNATTFGLFLAEQVVELDKSISANPISWFQGLTARIGDPVLREAIKKGMEILSKEFVSGIDIDDALRKFDSPKLPCSFDMLGEAARTKSDVDFFFNAYENAIRKVGEKNALLSSSFHEISIKLSAIHQRYEATKKDRVNSELLERVFELCLQSAQHDIALTIDAEEQDRLELSLYLIQELASRKKIKEWGGLGLAIQAYGKRAPVIVNLVDELGSKRNGIMMRLVKGAYWDQEIKIHQTKGAPDLPVFTSKSFTDINYLATAKIISKTKNISPYFATHNAHTIAGIMELYKGRESEFEFQRIFGMGELAYRNAKKVYDNFPLTRIYAPVGAKKELLPYLVRRLLENGANSSFVNKYLSENIPVDDVVKNPIEIAKENLKKGDFLKIVPRPLNVFSDRLNSTGFDFGDLEDIKELENNMKNFQHNEFKSCSIINGLDIEEDYQIRRAPFDANKQIGKVSYITEKNLQSLEIDELDDSWGNLNLKERIAILNRVTLNIQNNRDKFFYLLANEAGKTLKDCDAEVRESVDFINYYCNSAKKLFLKKKLEGPTGEKNYLIHAPKGNFLCISPWNFPMAIFIGQITAALVTGNNVIAKPAEDTSIIAYEIIKLFHESGVPTQALQLIIGGKEIGNQLTKNEFLNGVAFTGSSEAAKKINLNLANTNGPIKTLIAETGGQNVMFVDSSSLKEQVIDDIIRSAFLSAGQRCSALRVIYVQEEIAEEYWNYLNEAMQELEIGDPNEAHTDIGPIINKLSLDKLNVHINDLKAKKEFIECKDDILVNGYFIKPVAFKIDNIAEIDGEKFGPILHFISYKNEELDKIINEVNSTGFGLTMGVHSRITEKANKIFEKAKIGNFYLNRDIVGAVVGVQPFGGQGLSGTGPKAGGPNYLSSFVTEKTFTDNVMATGGNIDLLNKNNQ